MLDEPQIVQTDAQLTAIIRVTVPRGEIRNVMGPGIAELMGAVTAQGIVPAGPVFSHHLKMDPAIFDLEIGVPVPATAMISPAGRVRAGQLPATTVARTVYHLDRGGWTYVSPGSLGVLRCGPRVKPGPGHLAHRTQPSAGSVRARRSAMLDLGHVGLRPV